MYRIICLNRSDIMRGGSIKVYWRENNCGYTDNIDEAGLYASMELNGVPGKTGDWIAEPCWV